jgi:hypothetical protein
MDWALWRGSARSPTSGAERRRWRIAIGLSLVVLALAAIVHERTRPRLHDVALVAPDGTAQPVSFPYSAEPAPGRMEFSFVVHATALTQTSFLFVPDDHLISISVDGVDVSLAGVDSKKLDDYQHGFRFPLGRHLRRGDNRVVVRVANRGGPGGLDVRPDIADWRSKLEALAAVAACVVLLIAALRRAGASWWTALLAAVAVGIRTAYVSITPYSLRTHDVEGHIEYVEYLLRHHAVPRASEGFSFYHPPLYYALCAVVWKIAATMGLSRDEILNALQVMSVIANLGFCAFAIATARLWIDRLPVSSRSGALALFTALVLLWPASVIQSGLVGNDNLAYLFIGAGLYFASRWWLATRSGGTEAGADARPKGADRNALFAALSGALAVVTKTNGLLVFAVLVILLGAHLVERYRQGRPAPPGRVLKRAWPALALAVASSGLALGRSVIDTLAGRQGNVLVANANHLSSELAVGNRADNYLWFDARIFVTQAFTSPWDDGKGRQFFWNYLLKTALFGEYHFVHVAAWSLAVVLSLLFLGMCAHVVFSTLTRPLSEWHCELPLFLMAGGLLASLAALRMMIPNSCTGDFRYILPVLMPFLWWYVRGVGRYRERGWRKAAFAGMAGGWIFAALSVAFVAVVVMTEP